jgi:hypothetical protein
LQQSSDCLATGWRRFAEGSLPHPNRRYYPGRGGTLCPPGNSTGGYGGIESAIALSAHRQLS